eukprot:7940536-Alexandrium_andersonii.AAC.2
MGTPHGQATASTVRQGHASDSPEVAQSVRASYGECDPACCWWGFSLLSALLGLHPLHTPDAHSLRHGEVLRADAAPGVGSRLVGVAEPVAAPAGVPLEVVARAGAPPELALRPRLSAPLHVGATRVEHGAPPPGAEATRGDEGDDHDDEEDDGADGPVWDRGHLVERDVRVGEPARHLAV